MNPSTISSWKVVASGWVETTLSLSTMTTKRKDSLWPVVWFPFSEIAFVLIQDQTDKINDLTCERITSDADLDVVLACQDRTVRFIQVSECIVISDVNECN